MSDIKKHIFEWSLTFPYLIPATEQVKFQPIDKLYPQQYTLLSSNSITRGCHFPNTRITQEWINIGKHFSHRYSNGSNNRDCYVADLSGDYDFLISYREVLIELYSRSESQSRDRDDLKTLILHIMYDLFEKYENLMEIDES